MVSRYLSNEGGTDCIRTVTKDPHFPFWISSLDSIIRKDLFELESIFRQCDVVGLGVPFFETTEFVTIAELSESQSLLSKGKPMERTGQEELHIPKHRGACPSV